MTPSTALSDHTSLPIPYDTKVLIAELKAAYPHRCLLKGESIEDAHRYAGKVELIEELEAWMRETETGEA